MSNKCTQFINQLSGDIVFLAWTGLLFSCLLLPKISFALDNTALPTGGAVASGNGSISSSGSSMTVQQNSSKMIVNWDSFNIGTDADVTFIQPDRSSAALNRIQGLNPSQILGKLNANGQIFLVNPAGIIFGSSAQVNVGGLVASSLDIDDDDFLMENFTFQGNENAGEISNWGTINARNGYVALIAPAVENFGNIVADGGTAAMAAGAMVTLDFNGDQLVTFTIDKGAVDAQAANHGLIQADGGLVYLSARAANELTRAAVNNDGMIRAQTLEEVEGKILLIADMQTGTVDVDGTLDASAPDGGDGGFIETSAATVTIDEDLFVTTLAPGGKTGKWLIDPTDYTIAASGGNMTGAAVSKALKTTDFEIKTIDAGGNIYVNDTISWSANTLTLNADNDIVINSELNATGSARLNVTYTNDFTVNAPVNLASGCYFNANGTEYTIISSLAQLQDIATSTTTLANHYVLGSDINASPTSTWNGGAGFDPIGYYTDASNYQAFTGVLDGLGHSITDLYINRPSESYVGLFSYAYTAAIRNLGVTGTVSGYNRTGGLAGMAHTCDISNTYTDVNIIKPTSGGSYAGGLAGYLYYTTVTDSYTLGDVTGTSTIGGFAGYINISTITGCYAAGLVKGAGNVGGLVGIAFDSEISDSYFTKDEGGSVTGTGSNTGGLVGQLLESSTIDNSYVTADVTGVYSTAGLVAYSLDSSIRNSYATGDVQGTGTVGGLVSIAEDSTITECYASGNVTGSSTVAGGLVGYLTASDGNTSSITNSYATGNVEGLRSVGGLVGLMGSRINLDDLYDNSNPVGQILLTGGTCSITNSYATGDVTGTPGNGYFVGGLVGFSGALMLDNSITGFQIQKTRCTITNSYATGNATGVDYIGGLVGFSGAYIGTGTSAATITNVSSTIKNSYAGGTATTTGAGSNIGNFLGGSGAVWDGTGSGNTFTTVTSEVQNAGGSTITDFTNYMNVTGQKNLSFYKTILGWGSDIDDKGGTGAIWRIYEGYTYPLLRHFLTPISPSTVTKIYDGTTSLSGSIISWSTDTDESLIYGTASSSVSAINAGSYTTTLSGLYSSQQGYDILSGGTLNITPAQLTITANDYSKYYDGTAFYGGNGVTYSGFVNGENQSVLSGTLFYGGTGQGAVNVGAYRISASGLTAGNYNIIFVDGELLIHPEVADSRNLPTGTQTRQSPSPWADTATPGKSSHGYVGEKEDSGALLDVDTTIIEEGEMTVLSTDSSLLVINFEYSPQGEVTLLCGGASKNELQGVINALPVFLDEQGSRTFMGNYEVRESTGTVSIKYFEQEGSPYHDISESVQDIHEQKAFNLTKGEDKSAEFTVGVTDNGVIFVSRSDGGNISPADKDRIVIMALQIIKQDMNVNLKKIRGMVIVKENGLQHAI